MTDTMPIAHRIENFYFEAREHSARCECDVCENLVSLRDLALRLAQENDELKVKMTK